MIRIVVMGSLFLSTLLISQTGFAQNKTQAKKETASVEKKKEVVDENAQKREELNLRSDELTKKEQKIISQETIIKNKIERLETELNEKVIKESEYNAQKIELDKMLENVRAKKEEIQLERQQIKEEIKALP